MKYLCIGVLILSACGSAQRAKPAASSERGPSVSWKSVPQDASFVYSTVVPFSKLPWPGNDELGYVALGKRVRELEVQGVDARKQLPEFQAKVLLALELLGKDFEIRDQDLERIGVGAQSRLTMYGVGLNVVARIEVDQPEVLRGHLQPLWERLDLVAREKSWHGQSYWEFAEEDYTVVLAVLESELVAALAWHGDSSDVLPVLLQPPTHAVEPDLVFQSISDRTTVGDYVGYLDSAELYSVLEEIVGEMPEVLLPPQSPEQKAICTREQAAMFAAIPRVWLSGTMTKKAATGLLFVDLRSDLVAGLEKMTRPVPQASASGAELPYMTFSIGLDMGRLLGHSRNWLKDLTATTYECEKLQQSQVQIAEMAKGVQTLSMTPLAGLTGMAGFVKKRHLDERGNLELQGLLTIAHASPASLFNLLRLVPNAKLPDSLEVGAPPARFYMKEMALLGPTEVALGKGAVGFTVGMASELSEALGDQESEEPELLHLFIGPAFFADLGDDDDTVEGVYDSGLAEALLAITEGGIVPHMDSIVMSMNTAELGAELHFEFKSSAR